MHAFKDNKGRIWTLHVTVATIKRVRAIAGIDLANIVVLEPGEKPKMNVLERLGSDPVLLVDTLYAVCKPEADTLGISDVEFGESMVGDTIEEATTALMDEIIDFFPVAKRQVFNKIVQAARRFETTARSELKQALESGALDKVVENAVGQLTQSLTNVPESSV